VPNSTYPAASAVGLVSARPKAGFEDLRVLAHPRSGSKWKIFFLALLVVTFNSLGNLALAWGLKVSSETVAWNPFSYVRAMLNPFVAGGIVLLILWMLTRMALMSWADLSFALPLMALGYVMAAVLGKFVLHETVSPHQWLGTVFIFCGIALVGSTTHRTELRKPS
jgi:drug/metabolite transporter (DMT)-like permease